MRLPVWHIFWSALMTLSSGEIVNRLTWRSMSMAWRWIADPAGWVREARDCFMVSYSSKIR